MTPKQQGVVERLVSSKFTFEVFLRARVKNGWSIGRLSAKNGPALSGVFVYLIWLIELGVLIAMAAGVAASMIDQPFCERKQEWSEEQDLGEVQGVDIEFMMDAKSNEELDTFLNIDQIPIEEESGTSMKYTLFACGESGYLSVEMTYLTLDEKQNTKEEKIELLKFATLDATQTMRLRDAFGEGSPHRSLS